MRPTARLLYALMSAGAFAGGCADSPAPTSPPKRVIAVDLVRDVSEATFTPFAVPGATFTLPLDINEHGVIVGRYAAAGRTHGFLREETGAYTTIDFPGSNFSVAASINDSGAVAGWYTLPAAPAVRHGFILKAGVFTTIDPPGSAFTNVLGINERGDASGRYRPPGTGPFHGFAYQDGVFKTLDVPGATETDAFKLAASGVVVGGFIPISGPEQLFVFSHDEFTTYALPNGKSISLDNGGVNSHGDMVGAYCDVAFPCLFAATGTHGFLLTSRGEFTTIDYPGAMATQAIGINARGDIAGAWVDGSAVSRGFVLTSRGVVP
ncbi:MAG TPA: hypothetical protein VL383_02090 [Gemmatimonadaceae bacterium]|nr:hypothetical protein [Gemmatimonadaceae bacterium]